MKTLADYIKPKYIAVSYREGRAICFAQFVEHDRIMKAVRDYLEAHVVDCVKVFYQGELHATY